MPKWLAVLGAFLACVVSAYAIAASVNAPIPRWTWYTEHVELAGISLTYIRLQKERRKWEIEKVWPRLRNPNAPGGHPPSHIKSEYQLLLREIEKINRKLKK